MSAYPDFPLARLTLHSLRFGYTKFRAFGFTEYDHILLLDSDTLVVSRDVYNIFDNDLDFAGVGGSPANVLGRQADQGIFFRSQNSIPIGNSTSQ